MYVFMLYACIIYIYVCVWKNLALKFKEAFMWFSVTVMKSGSLNLLKPSGPVQAYNGIALPLTFYLHLKLVLLILSGFYFDHPLY
jgi:hypothetical protein